MIYDPNKGDWPYNSTNDYNEHCSVQDVAKHTENPYQTANSVGNDSRFPHDLGNCTCHTAPNIDDLYDHLKEVYHQKNHDYGNSFEDGLNEDGLIFAKMHLMEKYNRFKKLITEKNQVNGEGIRDSLLDMANYAIMTVHWMDKCIGQTE